MTVMLLYCLITNGNTVFDLRWSEYETEMMKRIRYENRGAESVLMA